MNDPKFEPGLSDHNAKRVRVVHATLSAGGIGGGLEKMETMIYRHLDRTIFDPVMVIMNDPIPGEVSYDDSIPYVYTGLENRFEALLKIFSDADIVVFNGGFDTLVCEAADASGVPCLIEVMHNTEPGQAYDNIDTTICVSETVKNAQPNRGDAIVIHNGVEIDRFAFDVVSKPENKITILEASRRNKPVSFHLDELADDLLPQDSRIELWLAGRGQSGESQERLKYLGLIREIEQVYGQADILMMLSVKEALGLCAIEAMACGVVPIVAADTGMREVVTHGVNGWLVDAYDRDGVISAVKEAVAVYGSEKWREMRAAARKTVEEKFDIVRCVKEYEKVYLDVLSRKGKRKPKGAKNLQPPPDVDIADAFFCLATGKDEMAEAAVRKIGLKPGTFKHKNIASQAKTLGRLFISRGKPELADILYTTLFRSGVKDHDMLRQWLEARTGDVEFIVDELIKLDPDNLEYIMLKVELTLNSGKTNEALKILENAVKANPAATDLQAILNTIKSKL